MQLDAVEKFWTMQLPHVVGPLQPSPLVKNTNDLNESQDEKSRQRRTPRKIGCATLHQHSRQPAGGFVVSRVSLRVLNARRLQTIHGVRLSHQIGCDMPYVKVALSSCRKSKVLASFWIANGKHRSRWLRLQLDRTSCRLRGALPVAPRLA